MTAARPMAVGASPVQQVLLVDRFDRPPGHRFVSPSLPGHLIQLMRTGRTRHETNGRCYDLRPGSLIWYHEDELVRGQVVRPPWSFYTLNFIAPSLSPPPFEDRVRQVGTPVRRRFEHLLACWRDAASPAPVRAMRVQAAVLALLADVWGGPGQSCQMDPSATLWWQVETWLRGDLARRIDLQAMVDHTHRSVATIARSCQAAVGQPPMKRVKAIRMSMARGLVERSSLRIGEVARRVGYERVHEFSRDYRRAFGLSPRAQRQSRQALGRPAP